MKLKARSFASVFFLLGFIVLSANLFSGAVITGWRFLVFASDQDSADLKTYQQHRELLKNVNTDGEQRKALSFPFEEDEKNITISQFFGYIPGQTNFVTLRDSKMQYFTSGINACLLEGTKSAEEKCQCKPGWHGDSCSIPDIVEETQFRTPGPLKIRKRQPKRIIYGIPFNMEFEMLELKLGELGDLIDAVIIVESNYTGFGKPKRLFLMEKLRSGYLKRFHHKIVYLFLDHFPTGSNPQDGMYTDFYTKNYASKKGLDFVKGKREDDIFIMSDADELHRREVLLFLKLHDRYPEPVGGYLRRNVFGFFWSSGVNVLGFACSLRMLRIVYDNKASELRGATSSEHPYIKKLEEYDKEWHNFQMWQIGQPNSDSNIAGWHCSWCFTPERVRVKLFSAYNYDFPRWGNYPEKTKILYIKHLIKDGMWFDEQSKYTPQYHSKHPPYAPAYAFNHPYRFQYLLSNPYILT